MRMVAASDTLSERANIRLAAHALGIECDVTDLIGLPARLRQGPTSLVLIGVGLDSTAALVAMHGAAAHTDAPIYVAFDGPATNDLPLLLRAGAHGYLRRHELANDLFDVVQELRTSGRFDIRHGQLIAVTGAQPGVGVTTVASNLASAIAADGGGRVALAQLTDGRADLALNLGIAPVHSLAEIAAGWHRLDPVVLERCLIHGADGVSILADQPENIGAVSWTPAALRHVLVMLRGQFDYVVADLGHRVDEVRTTALRLADSVAVVTRLDAPAVTMSKQFIDQLADTVGTEKIVAVVNRYGQNQQLAWKPARETMGLARFDRIADDPGRANEALNRGQLLVHLSPATPAAQDFAALAARWTRRSADDTRQRLGA